MIDKPELTEKKAPEPLPIDPEEVCDWDFDLGERPASRRKWRILVQLRKKKPEGPMPLLAPDEE